MKQGRRHNFSEMSRHVKSQNQANQDEKDRLPLLNPSYQRNRLTISVQRPAQTRQRVYRSVIDSIDMATKKQGPDARNRLESEQGNENNTRAKTVLKGKPIRYKLKKFMKEIQSSAILAPLLREKQKSMNDSMNFVEVYIPLLPRRHQKELKLKPIQEEQIDVPSLNIQQIQPIVKATYKDDKRYSSNSSEVLTLVIKEKEALTADPNLKNLIMGQIKRQVLYSIKPPINKPLIKKNLEPIRKKIRKIFNVILFTVYLRRFCRLIRSKRQHYITNYGQQGISDQLINLTSFFLQGQKKFANTVALHSDVNYHFLEKDSIYLQQKKILQVKGLLQVEMECICKSVKDMIALNFQDELIYQLCKHGSYSVALRINTQQQLDILCLSETEGYIRADKHLQKSGLITLIFIKVIIYSILLRPESMQFQANQVNDPAKLFINIKLIANIIYELLIQIQDNLLEKCGENYRIGNWNDLKGTFKIDFANSMTLVPGKVKKNELITGFMDQNYIKKSFKTDDLVEQKRMLVESVQQLHRWLKDFHNRYRARIF